MTHSVDYQQFPVFPLPHREVDVEYLSHLVRSIELAFDILSRDHFIYGTKGSFSDLPLNGNALSVGCLYNDNGTLKIVQADEAHAPSFLLTISVQTPTITTS